MKAAFATAFGAGFVGGLILLAMLVMPSSILPTGVGEAYAVTAGTEIQNSFRLDYDKLLTGDSIAVTVNSNTVAIQVELMSAVDVSANMDSLYVQLDTDYVFIKHIRNDGNGIDTFTLRTDSTVPSGAVQFYIDANADSLLTGVDPAVSQVVLGAGEETTILVSIRLPSQVTDNKVDTVSVVAKSTSDTDPATDTAKVVVTVDIAPPAEVVLQSPADSVTVKTVIPSFGWAATVDTGVGLSIYNIEVYDASDTDLSDTIRSAGLASTQWTVTPALQKGTYRWRVRAVDKLGNVSIGRDSRLIAIDTTFTIAPVSPADSFVTSDSRPTFIWSGDGETFQIQISRTAAFTSIAEESTIYRDSSYRSKGLADSTYFWRVGGVDSIPLTGTSAIRAFTVQSVDSSGPTEVSLLQPGDSFGVGTAPRLVWTRATDASGVARYIVEVSLSTALSFADAVRSASVTDTEWTITPALTAGSYRWHVKAVDTVGNVNPGTDSRTFAVDTGAGRVLIARAAVQPAKLTAQDGESVAVAVFSVGADTKEAVSLSRVRLTHVPGLSSSKVSQVRIYRDAGTASALDAADTLFASGTFSNDVASLTGTAFSIASGDTVNLLVVYQMSTGLTEGDTFQVQIASASDLTVSGQTSGLTPTMSGAPIMSKVFTVRSRYPSVVSVSPADGSLFLPPDQESGILPILVKFNLPIDSASISTTSIRLLDASGVNRIDTVGMADSVTVRIKAAYADTQWPYGTKFTIRVSTGIKDLDVPADSMQFEFVSTFETMKKADGASTQISTDSMAELIIDTGDIDSNVKGIVITILPESQISDTLLTKALNSIDADPYLVALPNSLAIYDYKVKKRDPNDTHALVKLQESDFRNPVHVAITVNKPTAYLEAKGTPLNFKMLRMGHFDEDRGRWDVMQDGVLEDNGNTVTIKAGTKKFSLFGVFFAFAPSSVKETFRSYPNPADPFTTYGPNASGITWQGFKFGYQMPKAGSVTIRIYDFAGQLVRVLGPFAHAANYNSFSDAAGPTWDGKNGHGQVVLNGAYFVFAEIRYSDGSFETANDRIAVVK